MKVVVGLMLVSFGTFWAGEGLGVRCLAPIWPSRSWSHLRRGDLGARPALAAAPPSGRQPRAGPCLLRRGRRQGLRDDRRAGPCGSGTTTGAARPRLLMRWLTAFGRFWWDFLVGDTPELLIGVLIALGVVALLVKGPSLNAAGVAAFPVIVAVMLGLSVYAPGPSARPHAGRLSGQEAEPYAAVRVVAVGVDEHHALPGAQSQWPSRTGTTSEGETIAGSRWSAPWPGEPWR